jgi:hypothetical protein
MAYRHRRAHRTRRLGAELHSGRCRTATGRGSPEQCRVAFLANLPMLISRRHVRGYIACVAAGIPLKIITPTEANQLLYLAQTALSAWKDGGR